jgi:iron complex outermembrane receptor protein
VIVQYKFTPAVMVYATYSEGVNPGVFNTTSGVQGLTAADQANFTSVYGYNIVVRPEHLTNYEAGLKGRFLDNKLSLSIDAYYDIWTNQINQVSAVYIESGATKLVSASVNNGRVIVSGVEGDATFRPAPHFELDVSGSINGTDIREGTCVTCDQITGKPLSTVYTGNQLPNVSKYQTAVAVQYSNTLPNAPSWDWFGRMDYTYKSGSYASQDNLVRTPDSNTVNFRLGLQREALGLELFVLNAFNSDAATNLATFYNVNNPFEAYGRPDALVAGLPPLRTYGIRLKYRFGG